ncbi:hypothetical protein HX910_004037 [Salmonella enterica]|nr:hypothetical protein [Salmonella enterica]EFP4636837.1 hypothetical protein [Salmonella enterica]EFS0365378.1 hypothetical protein [Salmonella enterica]EGK1507607.1 hypothetical protein [Salmonella enterica]
MSDGFLAAKRLINIARRFVFWRQHNFHRHISNDYNSVRSHHYTSRKVPDKKLERFAIGREASVDFQPRYIILPDGFLVVINHLKNKSISSVSVL